MRIGMVQFTASDDVTDNTERLGDMLAAAPECDMLVTPECSNLITLDGDVLQNAVRPPEEDPLIARVRDIARARGHMIVLGSVLVRDPESGGAESGGIVNRTVVIDKTGEIAAHYDKIHMFDVDLGDQSYKESARFQAGSTAVTVPFGDAVLGLSICYDVRFAYLYRHLATKGANILLVPAAFTRPTGEAHWQVLLRARAIENGAFVVAPAQTGDHPQKNGKRRLTYGHSLAVDPWGRVLADMGTAPGVEIIKLDLSQVDDTRSKIASLRHSREIQ